MNMEQWQNDDREKPNHNEKNLSQCHFIHYESHVDWHGTETEPPQWQASN